MKKFAIGCFGVLVVLALVGGGITWFKVIKPGMEFAGGIAELGQRYSELNDSIENRSAYAPPPDGVLTETEFNRFLASQRSMRNQLEGRMEELQQKYEDLEQEIDQRGGQASISDMMGAYSDLTDLLIDAKQAQVDALNSQDFSLQEYNWVRGQVYRALGESVAVAAIGESGSTQSVNTTVPDETLEMVAPHREELMQTYALAWWGL